MRLSHLYHRRCQRKIDPWDPTRQDHLLRRHHQGAHRSFPIALRRYPHDSCCRPHLRDANLLRWWRGHPRVHQYARGIPKRAQRTQLPIPDVTLVAIAKRPTLQAQYFTPDIKEWGKKRPVDKIWLLWKSTFLEAHEGLQRHIQSCGGSGQFFRKMLSTWQPSHTCHPLLSPMISLPKWMTTWIIWLTLSPTRRLLYKSLWLPTPNKPLPSPQNP